MTDTPRNDTTNDATDNDAAGKDVTPKSDKAAAMKDNKKPGPDASPVQVRNAGEDAQLDTTENWDEQDEALDESFPASDSSAKY
ncbi:hypothetical protein [Devosia sp.]|uniref:hypothetical protein n=1 Tax=Devosia sp. TaxID=1871048 RepID=UPI0027336F8E|nr:hypothetical protein [Devosia sp.]MDP2782461.1 hypothetical protein [Devosia sp.]